MPLSVSAATKPPAHGLLWWNESDGAPDCAYCGADIAEPSPRKRFCAETCRRRFWDYHTPQGKQQRVAAKRVWREQRRTAA